MVKMGDFSMCFVLDVICAVLVQTVVNSVIKVYILC